VVAAFYPAGGAGKDDLGHGHNLNCGGSTARAFLGVDAALPDV
jgi:hypothetical protein